jgi:hypothetical protein
MTQTEWGSGDLAAPTPEGEIAEPQGSWKPVKILVGILIALALIGAAGAYYFFVYRAPHAAAVVITGNVPSQIYGGEPFDLNVSIVNTSAVALQNPTLMVTMPDGIDMVDANPGTRSVSFPLDALPAGGRASKVVKLVAHGSENSVRQVQAVLQYSTPDSANHTFQASQNIQVSFGSSAVQLTIDGPQYIAIGKDFAITMHYKNNLGHVLPPTSIRMAYPATFTYGSAQPAPNEGNNQWNLPELQPGAEGTIQVHGTVAAGQSDSFPFQASVNAGSDAQAYVIADQSLTTQLLPQPLSVTVTTGNKGDIVHIADSVSYVVAVKNTATFPVENLVVTAKLTSPLFDPSSVGSDGSFSSLTNTITWNVASTPSLRALAPGQSTQVNFTVRLDKAFPIKSATDKNFTAAVDVTASSPTVPLNTALDRISATITSTIKFAGILTMDAQAYWKEPRAGVTNKGPYPPRVNQPTQYTVHWVIKTQASDMKDVHLVGSLQSGATWTGVVKSNQSTKPVYNTQTGEVTWDIPLVAANRGIAGIPAAEATFQIEQTPSANQAGREVSLFSATSLKATDVFTTQTLTARDDDLTTALPDDTAAPRSGAVIQQ